MGETPGETNTSGTGFNLARVSILAFLVLFSYAFSRPSIESLFLEQHGSEALPYAWIGVAITATLVVLIYNRFAAKRDLVRLFSTGCWISSAALVLLAVAHGLKVPGSVYALYVWKDVHVVVLLEMVWSFANVVFKTSTARWAYGLFCVAGSAGDFVGNIAVGFVSENMHTSASLWFPPVILLLAAVANVVLLRLRHFSVPKPDQKMKSGFGEGFRTIRASDYLPWLLSMILLVQIAITLVDYVYNNAVEVAITNTDDRTKFISDVYAAIALIALVLQLGTGIILRWVGVGRTLYSVPAILGTSLLAFILVPQLMVVVVTKVASKAFDYSVFRAAKEILYIPLSYEEKTRGKALIDMLTYRVAKGGASLILAGMLGLGLGASIGWITVAIVALWAGVTVVVVRRYRLRAAES